jgi:hypothetical protein
LDPSGYALRKKLDPAPPTGLFYGEIVEIPTLVSGTSQGRRNLELDMKPGWAPRPPEWLYT